MFIQPKGNEARKNAAPTVRVITDTRDRALKPEQDDNLFGEAALMALAEAAENRHTTIAFETVVEFMTAKDGHLTYQYVWMFSAWDGPESK